MFEFDGSKGHVGAATAIGNHTTGDYAVDGRNVSLCFLDLCKFFCFHAVFGNIFHFSVVFIFGPTPGGPMQSLPLVSS